MATEEEEINKKCPADSEVSIGNEKRIGCAHYKRRAKFVVSSEF